MSGEGSRRRHRREVGEEVIVKIGPIKAAALRIEGVIYRRDVMPTATIFERIIREEILAAMPQTKEGQTITLKEVADFINLLRGE